MRNLLILINLLLLISCKNDWIKNAKNSANEIDERAIVVKEFDTIIKDSEIRLRYLKNEKAEKTQAYIKVGKILEINSVYYKKDSLIFLKGVNGIDPIIHKGNENETSIGYLIDQITYFKNQEYGIYKERRIEINDMIEFDSLQRRLLEMEYEIQEIGRDEYFELTKELDRLKY